MSYLYRDPETNVIKKIRITNAIASYAFLTSPRPADSKFKAGQYGTDLIITDEETKALVKEYVKEVATFALKNEWGGKKPASLKLPYHDGDEEKEHEAGHMILSAGAPKIQPKLLIRDPRTGRASELSEEEVDEYYSGMLVDADIVFRAYSVGINTGITAYINAVCKVGEGTPFSAGNSVVDSFSLEVEPDEDSFDEPVTKAKTKKPVTKVEAADVTLDDLLDTAPKGKKTTATVEEAAEITLDDLLNA